jgi:hypothetical protein
MRTSVVEQRAWAESENAPRQNERSGRAQITESPREAEPERTAPRIHRCERVSACAK